MIRKRLDLVLGMVLHGLAAFYFFSWGAILLSLTLLNPMGADGDAIEVAFIVGILILCLYMTVRFIFSGVRDMVRGWNVCATKTGG